MPENQGTTAWLRSPSYLTVMHGRFESAASKQGEPPIVGSVMAIIVDARTGFVEGHYTGQAAPSVTGLSPITTP